MVAEILKYLGWLATPLGLWTTGLLALLVTVGFRRPGPRFVCLLLNLQLFAFSLPVTADFLLGSLEDEARAMQLLKPIKGTLDMLVVLGGGTESRYREFRELADLNEAADRLWMASILYKRDQARKLLVSGGVFNEDPNMEPESVGMRQVLESFGVPAKAIIEEKQSRTTLENAWYTARLLEQENLPKTVGLVTSAFHMPRAVALFEQAGLEVFPIVSDVRVVPADKPLWQYLPKPDALNESTIALKERLGMFQLSVSHWFNPVQHDQN